MSDDGSTGEMNDRLKMRRDSTIDGLFDFGAPIGSDLRIGFSHRANVAQLISIARGGRELVTCRVNRRSKFVRVDRLGNETKDPSDVDCVNRRSQVRTPGV